MANFSSEVKMIHAHWNTMIDGPMFGEVAAYHEAKGRATALRHAQENAAILLDTSRVLPPHCTRRVTRKMRTALAVA